MDIDISLLEDSRRLAKQCKMADLIEELENKCKQVYEFGKTELWFAFTVTLLIHALIARRHSDKTQYSNSSKMG